MEPSLEGSQVTIYCNVALSLDPVTTAPPSGSEELYQDPVSTTHSSLPTAHPFHRVSLLLNQEEASEESQT